MRILHVSDSHSYHEQLEIPPGIDMIIHSGDCSNNINPYLNEYNVCNVLHDRIELGKHTILDFQCISAVSKYFVGAVIGELLKTHDISTIRKMVDIKQQTEVTGAIKTEEITQFLKDKRERLVEELKQHCNKT